MDAKLLCIAIGLFDSFERCFQDIHLTPNLCDLIHSYSVECSPRFPFYIHVSAILLESWCAVQRAPWQQIKLLTLPIGIVPPQAFTSWKQPTLCIGRPGKRRLTATGRQRPLLEVSATSLKVITSLDYHLEYVHSENILIIIIRTARLTHVTRLDPNESSTFY